MADGKMKSESYNLMGGINTKASPYVNGPAEFRDLSNLNFVVPGALTKRPGSTLYVGATIAGRITGGVEFERLNGASYLVVTANTNAYTVTNSFNAFNTGLLNNALFDFVTFVDRLFACNGQNFFKFDGSNNTAYSLPPGTNSGFGATAVSGGNIPNGIYVVSYGYLNDRGYYGPASSGFTVTIASPNSSIQYQGMTTPPGFGISSIFLYKSSLGGIDQFGTTLTVGSTSIFVDTNFPTGNIGSNDNLYFTLAPRYMEIYNNQLFTAGFSSLPSTTFWSAIGEPEGVDPTYSAEFRTNDGDRVTGLKSYNGALVVTKERSFHFIKGDDPSNFLAQEVSDQYGCISNRAMVTFENTLWFLDTKGIAQYNGANTKIVSNKVEPIFTSMNVAAARENAVAIHYRDYNEVWFAIPCNGATFNNCIVVFDYIAGAWTKYDGIFSSSLFNAKGTLGKKTIFYGGYSGSICAMGASLFGDSGVGITCVAKTSFLASEGQSSEQVYRRFYLNVNPVLGVTQAINVNLYSNFGTTIQASRTMYQNPFQSRIDFGIPGRSIQAEVSHASATLPFQISGFTFESRHQRDV